MVQHRQTSTTPHLGRFPPGGIAMQRPRLVIQYSYGIEQQGHLIDRYAVSAVSPPAKRGSGLELAMAGVLRRKSDRKEKYRAAPPHVCIVGETGPVP